MRTKIEVVIISIFGRDMYSKTYRELTKEVGKIDFDLNEECKQRAKEQIANKAES